MTHSARTGSVAQRQFMPASQSLTMGVFVAAWQDVSQIKDHCWHTWLDLCEELSYAMAFYQEWQNRHKF